MNSTITFSDKALFDMALTALEMTETPFYVTRGLSIETDEADEVVNILNGEGIFMFDVASDELSDEEKDMNDDAVTFPGDDMDGDHASALASAGFGTDEDYGGHMIDEGGDW
jgi:hypothetical protein